MNAPQNLQTEPQTTLPIPTTETPEVQTVKSVHFLGQIFDDCYLVS